MISHVPSVPMLRSVTIDPPAAQWRDLVQKSLRRHEHGVLFDRGLAEWTTQTRRELLGDGPALLLATGHQSGFWHPGILAKFYAMDAIADALDADCAARLEIVVDQDDNDPASVTLPVTSLARPDTLATFVASLIPSGLDDLRDVPAGLRSPADACAGTLLPADLRPAAASIDEALREMIEALNHHSMAPSLAMQCALACARLRGIADLHAQPLSSSLFASVDAPRRFICPASHLTASSLWTAIIIHARRDPRALHTLYNRAVAAFPGADVAPLSTTGRELEMPFWFVDPDSISHPAPMRRRATTEHLSSTPSHLWPRGIFLTGFLRLALCDLFIHGTGGGRYDRITEQLMKDWLGVDLAPMSVVTATMSLDLGGMTASDADLARARWLSHHVRFDFGTRPVEEVAHVPVIAPADDSRLADLQRRRSELLAMIESSPRHAPARAVAFRELHELRRAALAGPLAHRIAAVDAIVASVGSGVERRKILDSRTWPFPFYPVAELSRLHDEIAAAFRSLPAGICSAAE